MLMASWFTQNQNTSAIPKFRKATNMPQGKFPSLPAAASDLPKNIL